MHCPSLVYLFIVGWEAEGFVIENGLGVLTFQVPEIYHTMMLQLLLHNTVHPPAILVCSPERHPSD